MGNALLQFCSFVKFSDRNTYHVLPNKGTGRSSKVISNHEGTITRLSFVAFQRWFRIEKWTIMKETTVVLVISENVVLL